MPIAKIDSKLCSGCGKCVDTCPQDVIRLNLQPTDVEKLSPCAEGCPAGVSVRKYAYYVEMDMLDEAIATLREYLPFPAVTGRICPHTCEASCARNEVDAPVNINYLERFVADSFLHEKAEKVRTIYASKVAVVGSGPAGLSCAYFLCRKGYAVTVFEKHDVVGGMMRLGIPDFDLPRDVLDAQLNYIADMGVEYRTGVNVGTDITFEELQKEYGAVFIAVGNQISRLAKLDGDSQVNGGLMGALDFLRDVHLGNPVEVKGRVAVIGGGNVAIDAARTAKRLGAKEVTMVCLECRDKMPAHEKEIQRALEDGVVIKPGFGGKRILSSGGNVTGIEFIACTSVFDKNGAFAPQYDESCTITVDADQIIFAVGQAADLSMLPEAVAKTGRNTIQADKVTLETSVPGIFAGGDAVDPVKASVVKAIASGKRAAESIDRYLRGVDMLADRDEAIRTQFPPCKGIPHVERIEAADPAGFTPNEARCEAMRCMTCGSRAEIKYADDCMVCLYCERDCPEQAIYVSAERISHKIEPWDLG